MIKPFSLVVGCLVALSSLAHGQFIINEFMADNVTADEDEDGNHGDWLEIKNISGAAASLNGWYLTDDAGNLRKWRFPVTTPVVTIPAGGFLTVWCDDKDRKAVATKLHTNFSLRAGGEYLALVRADGVTVASHFNPEFPQQIPNGTYGISNSATGYLMTPTRNAENSAIRTNIGPIISETTDRPAQPTAGGANTLTITCKVTKSLNNLPAVGANPVQLKWRRMYQNEVTINMTLTAADTYTAQIPLSSFLPGEMVRWRIEARDFVNNYTYDPPYPNFSPTAPPANPPPIAASVEAEMYYGTITIPTLQGNTLLPVLHWFVPPGAEAAVSTDTGARCSFFFQALPKDNPGPNYTPPKPRFYDNVLVDIHGQSSKSFPTDKKSYDLSFAKDNKFEWKDGTDRSAGTNLLTNYADKTKIRHSLAYWVFEKSGHTASHYATIVRVQRNGAFRGIYDLIENGNSSFLERWGLDKTDALYKMGYGPGSGGNENNTLDHATRGVEKKNPDDGVPGNPDLAALVNALNTSNINKLKYVYDNVDIESLINFTAVVNLIVSADTGWKNYYVYRDTARTGEWHPLPWDMDLTFGHTWNEPGQYFEDDIDSQTPLVVFKMNGNRLFQLVYQTPELNAMYLRRLRTLADQFIGGPSETNGLLVQRINAMLATMDPNPNNPASGTDDADLDMRAWGFWIDGVKGPMGSTTENGYSWPFTDSRVLDHTIRAQAARLTNPNGNPNPPYPASSNGIGGGANGLSSLYPFIPGRRDFYYAATPPTSNGMPFPTAQPVNLPQPLVIEQINPNPAATDPTQTTQDQEYFVIRNPNSFAVDISGWKLSGGIDLTFRGGTVIPGVGSTITGGSPAAAYINQMVVANKPQGFRARTASPKAQEYRFVVGPYDHQLSARGGNIILSKPNNPLDPSAGYTPVLTQPYSGTPTASQNFLRITELNYKPAPPTSLELASLAGMVAGDFEFMELTNTGSTTLNLGGARFEEGVDFTFPAGYTLAAGARCFVVASQAAFQIRYPTIPTSLIAGSWQGALDNSGERIRLLDSVGEEVFAFTYSPDWFPLPANTYRTLVTKAAVPSYDTYNNSTAWALSVAPNGSPNAGDPEGFSSLYKAWRLEYFAPNEIPTPTQTFLPAYYLFDPDGDNQSNFFEYAYGRNPKVKDSGVPVSVPGTTTIGSDTYLTITFTRPKNAIEVTYAVEANTVVTNPNSWTNVGVFVSATDIGNNLERVTYRDNVPINGTGGEGRYLRVRATGDVSILSP